jgi:glycerol-1-phosphate dehydrogenase [NAD(P)+]
MMADDPLEALLAGRLEDPDGGPPISVPTRQVVIAESLAGQEAELVSSLDLGHHLALVSDENTHRVLGKRVGKALDGRVRLQEVRLTGHPHADQETVEGIRREAAGCDAYLAVGAGTINDLCKYAAALDGKPYAVFGTAPSMNGYTSVNAAITVEGHKKSIQATAARGVFLDLEVLSQAPPRMIRAGLGDSLCRPTAQVDWLLAHLLLGEGYREAPFVLLRKDEAELFANSEALMSGDIAAMQRLARTLVMSGFGMTICGGSFPASQGEHLIAHYAEMMAPSDWPESFHGEQIGIATLTMARLQERLLANGPPRISQGSESELQGPLRHRVGGHLLARVHRQAPTHGRNRSAERAFDGDVGRGPGPHGRGGHEYGRAGGGLATGRRTDPAGGHRLARAEDIGWPATFYQDAVRHGRLIRDRYTVLDLAADSGGLDDPNLF